MAQSTLIPGSEVEVKVRYDRHGTERVCIFYEHLATLACHSFETFSRLVKENVAHLRSIPTIRITFLDKDNDWVDLTDRSFPKFIKCVKCDVGDNARLQIRVVDGSSPAVFKASDGGRTSVFPTSTSTSKRSLDTDFDTCPKKAKAYQSPIEIDIALKEDELAQKEFEFNEYSARFTSLQDSFGLRVLQDKSLPVCGRCHLRISKGHNKRNCQNRACDDIRQCGSLEYHADKKTELKEYEKLRDQAAAHVKKLKEEVRAKRRVHDSLNSTFEARIHTHLINSNPSKYLIDGARVRHVFVNADKAILRKHFNGNVPKNLDIASETFQSIIEGHESRFDVKKKPTANPCLDLLKDNEHYNVQIPSCIASSQTPSAQSVQSPATPMSTPDAAYFNPASPVYYPPVMPYYWYSYSRMMAPTLEPMPPTSPPPLPPPPPPEDDE